MKIKFSLSQVYKKYRPLKKPSMLIDGAKSRLSLLIVMLMNGEPKISQCL
jgi:hypothetical protein